MNKKTCRYFKVNAKKEPEKVFKQLINIEKYLLKKYGFKIDRIQFDIVNDDIIKNKVTIKFIHNNTAIV